jgi:hypothetical protein
LKILIFAAILSCAAAGQPKTGATKSPAAAKASEPKHQELQPSQPTNEAVCDDLHRRIAGWTKFIEQEAHRKAQAEIKLINCRGREKDKEALPGECKQFEEQIEGSRELLSKSEKEALKDQDLLKHYNCK